MVECNYLIFWRSVVILIVEGGGPPHRTGLRVRLGALARACIYCFVFLLGAEQRGVARLFSCGYPVAWWYLRRHRFARLLAILQLPVVVWLTASFGGFAITFPLLSYSVEGSPVATNSFPLFGTVL